MDEQQLIADKVDRVKNAILEITPTEIADIVKEDLKKLDIFKVTSFDEFSGQGFAIVQVGICVKHSLDLQRFLPLIKKIDEDMTPQLMDRNIKREARRLRDTVVVDLPERFSEDIQKRLESLIGSYVAQNTSQIEEDANNCKRTSVISVDANDLYNELIKIYSSFLPELTLDEFREYSYSCMALAFPDYLHDEVRKGINQVIDLYLDNGKEPRGEEINDDFLSFFKDIYSKLSPEERKVGKGTPFYACSYVRSILLDEQVVEADK